jgi:hypothetical protein
MGLGPTLTMGFVDENGNWTPVTETNPLPIEGGGGGATATWDTLDGKPAVIAAGDTAEEARTAIGAGTSNFSGAYDDLSGTPTIPSTAADVGLGNVDNTSDADKPVSTATANALAGKVDKGTVVGFGSGTTLPGSAPDGTVFFLYTEA